MEREIIEQRKFFAGYEFSIDTEACTACGKCRKICVFDAVDAGPVYSINHFKCEGCGACEDVCPAEAIRKSSRYCGDIFISTTHFDSTMVYARLIPGEDNSGKLVHEVRQEAKNFTTGRDFLVIDSPPGIGCPLTASITGVDMVAAVIECSRSGFNDAKRLIELAEKMRIDIIAVLNKSGLNPEIDAEIKAFLANESIPLAGELPFDERVPDVLVAETLKKKEPLFAGTLEKIFSGIAGEEIKK